MHMYTNRLTIVAMLLEQSEQVTRETGSSHFLPVSSSYEQAIKRSAVTQIFHSHSQRRQQSHQRSIHHSVQKGNSEPCIFYSKSQCEHLTPVSAGELKSQVPQDNEHKATKPSLFQRAFEYEHLCT